MSDNFVMKVICPANTYDRIHLEVASAIEEVMMVVERLEIGTPERNNLVSALEYLRMAKLMSQEGDEYTSRILEDEDRPEYGMDDEDECEAEKSCEDECEDGEDCTHQEGSD